MVLAADFHAFVVDAHLVQHSRARAGDDAHRRLALQHSGLGKDNADVTGQAEVDVYRLVSVLSKVFCFRVTVFSAQVTDLALSREQGVALLFLDKLYQDSRGARRSLHLGRGLPGVVALREAPGRLEVLGSDGDLHVLAHPACDGHEVLIGQHRHVVEEQLVLVVPEVLSSLPRLQLVQTRCILSHAHLQFLNTFACVFVCRNTFVKFAF